MKRQRQGLALVLALMGWLITNGCQHRYRVEFPKLREARENTKEQRLAALADSYKYVALEWDEKKNEYQTSFRKLTLKMLRNQLDDRLKDFEVILDYRNEEWARFIEQFKLRAEYERKEELIKAFRDRVRVLELDNEFQTLMGRRSTYWGPEPDPLDVVDLKKIFAAGDFRETFHFESDLVNEARKNGILQLVEEFVWFSNQTYGKKEPDLADPNDRFKFNWQSVQMGLQFKSYKVVNGQKPRDSDVDYIEGTRILVDHRGNRLALQEEGRPVLKIFVLENKAVVVVDQDKEKEIGFGMPEMVIEANKIVSAKMLMSQSVVELLFPEKPKDKRRPPPSKPDLKVEIALVGVPIDLWEKAAALAGWRVPFPYKNTQSDNYYTKILAANPKKDINADSPEANVRQIEYIAKVYEGNGSVMEYYRPKAPFNEKNVAHAYVEEGKRIRIEFSNGESRSGMVAPGTNIFIEDRPYRIVFTEGEKRYIIWDKDNDGKYELRLETSTDVSSGIDPGANSSEGHAHHLTPLNPFRKD